MICEYPWRSSVSKVYPNTITNGLEGLQLLVVMPTSVIQACYHPSLTYNETSQKEGSMVISSIHFTYLTVCFCITEKIKSKLPPADE